MTKKSLAEQIYQTVQNCSTKKEAIAGIKALLGTLEPKDRSRFCQWGQPNERSTPEKCWK